MSHSFEALEGQYQLCSCPLPPYKDPQTNNVAVRLSFLENVSSHEGFSNVFLENTGENPYSSREWNMDSMYCYNIGKEIFIYLQDNQSIPIDRRVFKVSPTCHCFKPVIDGPQRLTLLVGLMNGEIHVISPMRKDVCKVFNEEKSIDKSPVTCISWVPDSPNQFLVSHSSGHMYLYDEKLASNATPPAYELFKDGTGFSVYTCKAKSTRNPLYRWVFGMRHGSAANSSVIGAHSEGPRINRLSPHLDNGFHPKLPVTEVKSDTLSNSLPTTGLQTLNDDNASINQFAFSPCGKYLALVTQDGYLRVLEYHTMELYGFMRSYFAGLLCVDWSPDCRFVVVGGQDDLITVWSMVDRAVICRGQGHRSWVSTVRFDPFRCPPGTNSTNGRLNACGQSPDDPNDARYCQVEQKQTHSDTIDVNTDQSTSVEATGSGYMAGTYRLGSVGQDTLLCLWDLTDDVIRQGLQFVQEVAPTLHLEGGLNGSDSGNPDFNDPLVINPMHQITENHLRMSLSPTVTKSNRAVSNMASAPTTLSAPGLGAASGRNMSNLFGFLTLNRRKVPTASSNSASHTKALTPNYGSDRIKSSNLVHRFSMTMAHGRVIGDSTSHQDKWVGTEDTPSKTSSLGRLSDSSRLFDVNEQNLFGSPVCPKFGDIPVLEPIVTTFMHQHRLTDLVFRRDTVHVVCQQGLMRAWLRPARTKEPKLPDTRPSSFAESAPSVKNPVPRSRPSGTTPHNIISPSTSVHPAITSASDSPDCVTARSDPYFSSAGEDTNCAEPKTPLSSYRTGTHSLTVPRADNDPMYSANRSSLDYQYLTGTGVPSTRLYGRSQSSTASGADV